MPRVWGCAVAAAIFLAAALPAGRAAGAGSAAPSCAEGPVLAGGTIYGTPCDDRIVAPPGVAAVNGGEGDDTIVAAPVAGAVDCSAGCFLDIGSQTFEGGPGNDVVYGERGNDRLFGGGGDDQLFGGIGDDLLRGGAGGDRLLGGFGHDSIDGEADDDYVRGDATVDSIVDRGGGTDTLSYSSGITPGFFNNHSFDPGASDGLPPLGGERGVYLDLSASPESENGDNGVAPFGGGIDKVEGADFEVVIGTPFSDYIVGTGNAEAFYGGGGGDVIFGGDGDDSLHGGADGDHLDGGGGTDGADGGPGSDHCANATATVCEPANDGGVVPRDPTKVVAGQLADGSKYAHLYLAGSSTADEVVATFSAGSVTFSLGPGSTAAFDTSPAAAAGCNPPSGAQLVCPLAKPLDSIVLAGLGGADELSVSGFPDAVGIVIAGGEGGDSLTGREGEDILADGPDASGPGSDVLSALGGDDALLNNDGFDQLSGGAGNDLFLSDSICDGDAIDGGSERDNASWTKFDEGVAVRLDTGEAGEIGAGGAPECSAGTLGDLDSIEDLEGTVAGDVFFGSSAENQLLGWDGADTYSSGGGADRILANSGDTDPPIACGDGTDMALIDRPPYADVAGADCENVHEGDVNNFRVATELEVPPQPPPAEPVQPGEQEETRRPPRSQPRAPCVAGARQGPLRCAVRPRRLSFAPLGTVKRIRWTRWGGKRAIGFGRLVAGRCCGRSGDDARAKVRAAGLRSCDGRGWYTRLTVTYGRNYGKPLMRRAISATPCG